MAEYTAIGRVYFEPEPERGAHPGVRGVLKVDALGVHVSTDCEWLSVDNAAAQPGEWPMGEWEWIENDLLIPWHRVNMIEWGAEHAAAFDDSSSVGAAASNQSGAR